MHYNITVSMTDLASEGSRSSARVPMLFFCDMEAPYSRKSRTLSQLTVLWQVATWRGVLPRESTTVAGAPYFSKRYVMAVLPLQAARNRGGNVYKWFLVYTSANERRTPLVLSTVKRSGGTVVLSVSSLALPSPAVGAWAELNLLLALRWPTDTHNRGHT